MPGVVNVMPDVDIVTPRRLLPPLSPRVTVTYWTDASPLPYATAWTDASPLPYATAWTMPTSTVWPGDVASMTCLNSDMEPTVCSSSPITIE